MLLGHQDKNITPPYLYKVIKLSFEGKGSDALKGLNLVAIA